MTHAQGHAPYISDLLRMSREASIHELCLPHALSPQALEELKKSGARARELKRGERLFRQGYGLHAVYAVSAGLLKTVMVDSEGREQIIGFHFPRDLVGLDALHHRAHVCMATAVVASRVCVIPLHALEQTQTQAPALRGAFERLISKALAEHEQLLMVVNQRSAVERIAVLLFSLACRMGQNEEPATELSLPMPRTDIGNYLGLATETVSRAIHDLQTAGVLEGHGKHLRIVDPRRLAEWAISGRHLTP